LVHISILFQPSEEKIDNKSIQEEEEAVEGFSRKEERAKSNRTLYNGEVHCPWEFMIVDGKSKGKDFEGISSLTCQDKRIEAVSLPPKLSFC
jgi:hypothetical protein